MICLCSTSDIALQETSIRSWAIYIIYRNKMDRICTEKRSDRIPSHLSVHFGDSITSYLIRKPSDISHCSVTSEGYSTIYILLQFTLGSQRWPAASCDRPESVSGKSLPVRHSREASGSNRSNRRIR